MRNVEQTGEGLTWTAYKSLLVARYVTGGMAPDKAAYFADGEINAILAGNHWTHGKPTPADPQQLIFNALSDDEREQFTERAGILEHDAGMSRADAEAQAITGIISRKSPAPQEKPRSVYRGSEALKNTLVMGIGIKFFFSNSKDNDPSAYTTDLKKIAAMWNEGQRRFKAFIRGRFLAVDVDRKPGKLDGLETFYRIFPRETLPAELRGLPDSFPCYVQTPSGGFHLYFRYEGPELKLRELAPGVEIKEWQITAPGSRRENNGEYILHGELSNAPPLYGLIADAIGEAKRKKNRQRRNDHSPGKRPQRIAPCVMRNPGSLWTIWPMRRHPPMRETMTGRCHFLAVPAAVNSPGPIPWLT